MFKCCVFLVIILNFDILDCTPATSNSICPLPTLAHGRVRVRQRVKLVKFMCNAWYELVGNKYATCRNGKWDVPMPVCVRAGCSPPHLQNGIQLQTRGGAWLLFFCLPNHRMVGSSAIYCDGYRWNDTAPTCIDSTTPPKLSCDFEEASICEWTQDELHDFDWRRLNKKTPSSFIFTGPSFDHTFGNGGSGYYMYIESTSRMENDSARLLSPIYSEDLAKNGCFSFYYHMFGKSIGGLRVYQKPDKISLQTILNLNDADRVKYQLFEKWGNQGDFWFGSVNKLRDFSDNFQIVIEGIRGSSFASDIAIDDVSILQGDACIIANNSVSTPSPDVVESCKGRCDLVGTPTPQSGCGCTASCISDSDCCEDFFEACVFIGGDTAQNSTNNDDTAEYSSDNNPPQTEKLVATNHTISEIPEEVTVTKTSTITTKPAYTTTQNTFRTTISTKTTIPKTASPEKTTLKNTTTRSRVTIVFKTTTPPPIDGGKASTKIIYKETTTLNTQSNATNTTEIAINKDYIEIIDKEKNEDTEERMMVDVDTMVTDVKKDVGVKNQNKSTSVTTTVIVVIIALACITGATYFVISSKLNFSKGYAIISRLRPSTRHNAEVRYLTRDEEIVED